MEKLKGEERDNVTLIILLLLKMMTHTHYIFLLDTHTHTLSYSHSLFLYCVYFYMVHHFTHTIVQCTEHTKRNMKSTLVRLLYLVSELCIRNLKYYNNSWMYIGSIVINCNNTLFYYHEEVNKLYRICIPSDIEIFELM